MDSSSTCATTALQEASSSLVGGSCFIVLQMPMTAMLLVSQELWAIDSRDCPWVPELDHLNQDLASHQDSSVDAETAGTSMSSAAVPAKASPITKQVASQLGHTTGSGAIPAADSPSAPAAGTPAQGPDLQHPSSCSTTLAPDNARTGALLQQSWFSAAVGTRTAVARLRSKYTTPACLDWPLLISQCGHKDASQIGALFERHFQASGASAPLEQHQQGCSTSLYILPSMCGGVVQAQLTPAPREKDGMRYGT
jgi:hypothetical protein